MACEQQNNDGNFLSQENGNEVNYVYITCARPVFLLSKSSLSCNIATLNPQNNAF